MALSTVVHPKSDATYRPGSGRPHLYDSQLYDSQLYDNGKLRRHPVRPRLERPGDLRPVLLRQRTPDEVPRVARIAVDVELGGQQFPRAQLDLEVDVRGASGIRRRPDRVKAILAAGADADPGEALERGIGLASIARVVVVALRVTLPHFHRRAGEGRTAGIGDGAGHPRRLSLAIAEDPVGEQIIVDVAAEVDRVERPLFLRRSRA